MASIDTSPGERDAFTLTSGGPGSPGTRWTRVAQQVVLAAGFVGVAVMVRGGLISDINYINPDEIELVAQARAAMRSPAPFTTWTTSTTGPVSVLLLALLGAIGFPMTAAFAHLLAAILVGVMGYFGFALARRWLGPAMSAVITGFWWLPIVLTLAGPVLHFGSLATEVFPSALLFAAAAVRIDLLSRRPVFYLAVGLLCGLSIGAKFQAAPVALALLATQVIRVGNFQWRAVLRHAVLWGVGVMVPFLISGLLMVVAWSDVSGMAIGQTLTFLRGYGGMHSLQGRLSLWSNLVTSFHLVILFLVVCWLGSRSTGRIQVCRLALVSGGLVAVYVGGMGFEHYLFFLYTAIALAIGLPLKPDAQLVPYVRHRLLAASTVLVILAAAWFVAFGSSTGTANFLSPRELSVALSKDSVNREPTMVEACPVGSHVLVWGLAAEVYVNYDYVNVIPHVNFGQLTVPANYSSSYDMLRRAIDDPATDCVVDAVGPPFFLITESSSLTTVYPQISGLLNQEYRKVPGAFPCEICTVYVRL